MTPSPQQAAFVTACAEPGSIILDSVAGSGKTTTLALGSHVLASTGRATSFSKPTVMDLAKAMSPNFPAKTMHAEGRKALLSAWNSVHLIGGNIPDKNYEFIKAALADADENWQLIQPIKKLVSHAQTAGIVPDHHRFLLSDTKESWEGLTDQYDLPFSPTIHRIARAALLNSNKVAFDKHIISFDDMLYIPLFFPIRVPQYKTLIVDEAQDLSPIQHALLSKQLRPEGRIIAAGDENQAIYAFRGAQSDSYAALARKFNAVSMQLTVSFRCARAIVQEAQQYVPQMEWAPGAPEGAVIHHNSLPLSKLPSVVLCRNNAPLIRLALRLLVTGISAEVAGRDIGAGLIGLTKRIAAGRNSDWMKSSEFTARLHRWADREIKRKPKSGPRIKDKTAALEAMAQHYPTLGAIRHRLGLLYVDPTNQKSIPAQVHLTTIHKAKGKEWDEVLFLDPELLPALWAEQEWELRQESNLAYVAITRAKTTLHYCSSKNIS